MRIALVVAVSALVAGCSSGSGESVGPTESSLATGSPSSSTATKIPTPTSTKPSLVPASPPARGAEIGTVITWIEAGVPSDVTGYHSMTRNGVSTPLGDGVAFTTAGTEANCVTNEYQNGALACLVKLADPPPRPPNLESAWKSNWVDFSGTGVDVGSLHGDPGPFVDGTGAELPAGHALAFGDYRCRADAAGLFCVDYAHRTAVKLSAGGVEGFGCLTTTTPPPDIGLRLSC